MASHGAVIVRILPDLLKKVPGTAKPKFRYWKFEALLAEWSESHRHSSCKWRDWVIGLGGKMRRVNGSNQLMYHGSICIIMEYYGSMIYYDLLYI